MNLKFKVDGQKELEKQLKKLSKSFEPSKIEKVSLASAKIISNESKNNAPLGPTGNLKKANIAKLLNRKGNQPAPAIAAVDRKIAPHANFVENGTSKSKANPFFRKAVSAKSKEASDNLIKGLETMVNEAVK